jgi:glycosyltransferase involved in cell wall biosynthesis
MKIAIFTDTYPPEINGVSICVNLLANELSKNNKVIVFAPEYDGGNKEGNGTYKVVRVRSVPLPVYNTIRFSLPNIVELYRALKKFDPDIVHFHTPGPLGIASIILSKSLKVPLVTTYHMMYNELLFYVSPVKRLKKLVQEKISLNSSTSVKKIKKLSLVWKKIWKTKRKKESRVEKITWRAIVEFHSLCDAIIIPSPSVKEVLDKKGLKGKTINIYNGVDIGQRFPAKKDYSTHNNIVFVGRLAEEKKIDVLIKAFGHAKRQLPKLKLTIAGDGPVMESLKHLAKKLNVEGDVKFLGMVSQQKLSNIYQYADIFAITSTAENQALVVLEAMASGLPIVGVKKHGLVDVIENSKNGYLVKPGDTKSFARQLVELIKDQKLRERMGQNSRQIAEDYDILKTTDDTLDLYRSIV